MKTNQTTTIETRYLRTLLEVTAQEAGLIVQRFARLALGEDAEPTGDRFLDYIGAEMAECAARIAERYEALTEARAEAGRIGGVRSGEARRAKQTKQTKQCFKANEANKAPLEANEAEAKQTKLNIPNHTIPNHTEPYRIGGSGGSGSEDLSEVSVSDSATAPFSDAEKRAAAGEVPRKADFLYLPEAALVDAALRLVGEPGSKGMRARLRKAVGRIGGTAFGDCLYQFAAEMEAGEVPRNPAAALNARLAKAEEESAKS